MEKKQYSGVIYYNREQEINNAGENVTVKRYSFTANALLLIHNEKIEAIPYHSFYKASFDKLEKDSNNDNKYL